MAISFKCSQCQAVLKVGDELAGRRGKCPKCQATVQIPAAGAAPAKTAAARPAAEGSARKEAAGTAHSTGGGVAVAEKPPKPEVAKVDPEQLRAKILTSFRGEVTPLPISSWERLKLFFLACIMLMLPVAYILFVGVIAAGLVWHLIANIGFMSTSPVVYFGPAVVGLIAVAFLLKPLLLGPAKEAGLKTATRQKEPLLFDFIDQICKRVHAPSPGRIEFDCSMNAAAEKRGAELQFRIGLPVLGCMSLDQFGGIVARQFARYSRSAGGRSSGLCCTIHDWLVRCVFEQDRFDRWLWRVTSKPSGYILYPLRGGVWLTRKLMWPLMYVAHRLATTLVRRREVNADRYEARIVGSEQFAKIIELHDVLQFTWQGAHADLEYQHKERRLVDNLPQQVMRNLSEIPEEVRSALAGSVPPPPTNPYSSRLTDQERLEVARQEAAEGVFHSDFPAHALLADFDALARDLTWDYYLSEFGPPLVRRDLRPVNYNDPA